MTGTLAILGPGALGLSTAQWAAECGLEVRLLGRDLDHARQGLREIELRWGVALRKGALTPLAHEQARSRIQAAPFGPGAMEGVSTLLEALPEDPDQKAPALAAAAGWGGADLLLLSGTSALPISDLAEAAGIQKRLLGFHLFVPVPRMAVVEIAVPIWDTAIPGRPDPQARTGPSQARGGREGPARFCGGPHGPGPGPGGHAAAGGRRRLGRGPGRSHDPWATATPWGRWNSLTASAWTCACASPRASSGPPGIPASSHPPCSGRRWPRGNSDDERRIGFYTWDPDGRRL